MSTCVFDMISECKTITIQIKRTQSDVLLRAAWSHVRSCSSSASEEVSTSAVDLVRENEVRRRLGLVRRRPSVLFRQRGGEQPTDAEHLQDGAEHHADDLADGPVLHVALIGFGRVEIVHVVNALHGLIGSGVMQRDGQVTEPLLDERIAAAPERRASGTHHRGSGELVQSGSGVLLVGLAVRFEKAIFVHGEHADVEDLRGEKLIVLEAQLVSTWRKREGCTRRASRRAVCYRSAWRSLHRTSRSYSSRSCR